MYILVLMLIAFAAGSLLPIQSALNGHLGKTLNHPFQAVLISFIGAFSLLFILMLILQPPLPSIKQLTSLSPIYYLGGVFGVIFVTTIVVLTPKIGVTNTLAATIVGQLVISIIVDHWGILNALKQPISFARILGVLLLFSGLYFIQK